MVLAWAFLIPLGSLVPRFWRAALPKGKWLKLHLTLQVGGVLTPPRPQASPDPYRCTLNLTRRSRSAACASLWSPSYWASWARRRIGTATIRCTGERHVLSTRRPDLSTPPRLLLCPQADGSSLPPPSRAPLHSMGVTILAVLQLIVGKMRPHAPAPGTRPTADRRSWHALHVSIAATTLLGAIYQAYTATDTANRLGLQARERLASRARRTAPRLTSPRLTSRLTPPAMRRSSASVRASSVPTFGQCSAARSGLRSSSPTWANSWRPHLPPPRFPT